MRTAMSNETKETGSSFMEKLSTVIVDKRNLIFLLTIILLVFSAFSRNWVEVESDLTYYLPSDSETKQAPDGSFCDCKALHVFAFGRGTGILFRSTAESFFLGKGSGYAAPQSITLLSEKSSAAVGGLFQ